MTNALLGIARLNNFRLNALEASTALVRKTKASILLNGVDVRARVRVGSLTVRDAINDAPNSAAFAIEGIPPVSYAATVLADAPLAYWRLGDITATAADQTGRGHTGTVFGAVTINQPGAVVDGDRAMHFPGVTGARVEIAAAADLALTAYVTVEAWVKTDGLGQTGGILEKTVGGVLGTAYGLYQSAGFWTFRVNISGTLVQVTAPVDPADVGQWVHLVAGWVSTSAGMWIYKNGVLVASVSAPAGAIPSGAGQTYLGHLGSSLYPFTGLIDEVAIYPFLGGTAAALHYTAGRPPAGASVGQDVRVSIGVDAPVLLFNGALTQVDLSYEGRAKSAIYHCSATDDTARANRRRPFGQWTTTSATVIAQSLIATFVPGFNADFVQANLPAITVIFDGSEGLNRCLTQITNLIGGYWYFADKQLHLFLTEASAPPAPIDAAHPFLEQPRITASVEMSQIRTRVYGRGHGEALLSAVLPGETLIPIASAVMFNVAGGRAIALSQVFTYTSLDLGGIGSLVGPGAAPSVAVAATVLSGAGLSSGLYAYAYTFVTAAGESLPGPLATVTTGVTPAPATAPVAGLPTIGPGPDPGVHLYAVTFGTTSGETTAGPSLSVSTGYTSPPSTPPGSGPPTAGATGPDVGVHEYAVTFMTSIGETTPGPSTYPLATAITAPPQAALLIDPVLPGAGVDPGLHDYGLTFVTASGETNMGLTSVQVLSGATPVPVAPVPAQTTPYDSMINDGLTVGAVYRYMVTYSWASSSTDHSMESAASPISNSVTAVANLNFPGHITALYCVINTSFPPPAGVKWVHHYRTVGNGSVFYLANTFGAYPWGGYDSAGDATIATHRTAPTVPTQLYQQVPLRAIPIGDANVTARQLYRRFNGTGPFRLLVTIPNNTDTTMTDTVPNASLGPDAPTTDTAILQQFHLTIPVGDANVTARKIYRRFNQAGAFNLAATIPNNTATGYIDTVPNAGLGAAAPVTNTAYLQQIPFALPLGGALVTSRRVYRTVAGGIVLLLAATIADNVSQLWVDTIPDASLGAPVPSVNTATANQVSLKGIALGAAAVTARKVYRTAANGSLLKLLVTLADNTTTTYLDVLADAALGAAAPVGDSSGLTQPQGQVNAGSPTLPTASSAPFFPTGGWVLIGTQAIRYTGIAGNTLTGIPPSGPGALQATVRYGDHLLAAPMLMGVTVPGGALLAPVGTVIYLWVQRDDAAAQAAMAQSDGSDGIYEYLVQDERRGEPSITALCDAHLIAYKAPIQTITYATRDLATKSGKAVTVNLQAPAIQGTLVIQDVTIDQIDLAPGLAPRFLVVASTVRFSLEDLLRQLTGSLEGLT